MPVLKLYQNGLTGGCPPAHPNQNPAPRGDCKGWSLRTSGQYPISLTLSFLLICQFRLLVNRS